MTDEYCESCDEWFSENQRAKTDCHTCPQCGFPLQTEPELEHEGMVQLGDGTWVAEDGFDQQLRRIDQHFNSSETAVSFLSECQDLHSYQAQLEKLGKQLLEQTEDTEIRGLITSLIDSHGWVADPKYVDDGN